jgi:hypothetical protein
MRWDFLGLVSHRLENSSLMLYFFTAHVKDSLFRNFPVYSVEGGDPSVQDSGSGSANRSGKLKQMTEGNERVRGRCSRITSSK